MRASADVSRRINLGASQFAAGQLDEGTTWWARQQLKPGQRVLRRLEVAQAGIGDCLTQEHFLVRNAHVRVAGKQPSQK